MDSIGDKERISECNDSMIFENWYIINRFEYWIIDNKKIEHLRVETQDKDATKGSPTPTIKKL